MVYSLYSSAKGDTMRNYIVPTRVCSCGKEWKAQSGGQGRRNKDHCDECYPIFRRAYKLWYAALNRSRKNSTTFNLTVDWIFDKLKRPCPKTGVPFVVSGLGTNYADRNPYSASIDKIDPDRGYTIDNCQVVSWLYNCAKQRFSEEEVYDFCLRVVNLKNINRATNADQVTD